MDEKSERIDRGTWWHDGGDAATSGMILSGLPMGDYRIYAEPVVEEPLNERMAHYWGGWWGPTPTDGIQRAHRMQRIIDVFGLVERSKRSDPIDVPDWVQRWLDNNVSVPSVVALKAWVSDAVISGAVRVETPKVPADVKKAASDLSLMYGGAAPLGHVGTLLKWVLDQGGDSDG